jgi:hypothetical protein
MVGESPAVVESAAMIAPGLFRLVIVVPEGVSGNMPVVVDAAGRKSQSDARSGFGVTRRPPRLFLAGMSVFRISAASASKPRRPRPF